MQALRVVFWMLIAAVVVGLLMLNLQDARFNVWPAEDGKSLGVNTGVGVIALSFFLLGFVPMWLISRASKWRLQRRIATLENTVAANSVVKPVATSTQLEAAAPPPPPPSPPSPEVTL